MKDYDEEVTKQINTIKRFLKAKFTNEKVFTIPLEILADNLQLAKDCKDAIGKDLLLQDRFGGEQKNPLLLTLRDAQVQAFKVLQEFGCTPKQLAKLVHNDEDENDELMNFLNSEE